MSLIPGSCAIRVDEGRKGMMSYFRDKNEGSYRRM